VRDDEISWIDREMGQRPDRKLREVGVERNQPSVLSVCATDSPNSSDERHTRNSKRLQQQHRVVEVDNTTKRALNNRYRRQRAKAKEGVGKGVWCKYILSGDPAQVERVAAGKNVDADWVAYSSSGASLLSRHSLEDPIVISTACVAPFSPNFLSFRPDQSTARNVLTLS